MLKRTSKIDSIIARCLYRLALLIHDYSIPFLVVPLLITGCLASGIYYKSSLEMLDVEDQYTPTDGPSHYEKQVADSYWADDPTHYIPGRSVDLRTTVQMIIRSRDGKGLTRPGYMTEVDQLNKFILNEIYIDSPLEEDTAVETTELYQDGTYGYERICMRFGDVCSFTNSHTFILDYLIKHLNDSDYRDRFTYPRMSALPGSVPLYVGSMVGGVRFREDSQIIMQSFQTVYLVYYLRWDTEEFAKASYAWELEVVDLVENYMKNETSLLDIAYLYSESLPQGLVQNERVLVPKFAISFALLIAFATAATIKVKGKMKVDWVESKQLLALAGVFTAGMAIVSAMGLLLFCGLRYVSVVSVMPFLILAIGVDDMFIMISSWRRCVADSLRTRVAETLADASVSITITSVTSFLSFAVGSYSSINAIKHFCLYSSLAIAFNYVYQITFFVACMVYAGKAEQQRRNGLILCLRHESKVASKPVMNTVEKVSNEENVTQSRVTDKDDDVAVLFFRNTFGPFLLKPAMKCVVLLSIVIYLAVGVWGLTNLRQGLKVQSVYLRDFHAVKFFDYLDTYVFPQGMQLEVVVSSPPTELWREKQRQGLLNLVASFEDTEYSSNRNFTDFWLFEYEKFLNDADVDDVNKPVYWTRRLYEWAHLNFVLKTYSQDFVWRSPTPYEKGICACDHVVDAFRFRIGIKNFNHVENQRRAAQLLRSIASSYPQYNITTYAQYWPFMDQYLVIVPTLLKNIALALTCVVVCSLIFIPSPLGVVWITAAIISIDIGVIGYMTHWGVNLDAITMITIIMSIGLSVDYTAHIAYGYVAAKGSPDERAIQALEVLGLPVIQGAASSIIGVLVLGFIPSYMVEVFFKTIILVVVLGMTHACIFLPVLFSVTGEAVLAVKSRLSSKSTADC